MQGKALLQSFSPGSGLPVIVEASDLSRKTDEKLRYGIACTLRLLFVDPETVTGDEGKDQSQEELHTMPRNFAKYVTAMVLILNGTITSIAYDYVEAVKVPEKWNLSVAGLQHCRAEVFALDR